jgi:hypothetical protein
MTAVSFGIVSNSNCDTKVYEVEQGQQTYSPDGKVKNFGDFSKNKEFFS